MTNVQVVDYLHHRRCCLEIWKWEAKTGGWAKLGTIECFTFVHFFPKVPDGQASQGTACRHEHIECREEVGRLVRVKGKRGEDSKFNYTDCRVLGCFLYAKSQPGKSAEMKLSRGRPTFLLNTALGYRPETVSPL